MRTSGAVATTAALGRHDHVCWPYASTDDFRERALEFLAEGVALGQRVVLVADAPEDRLRAEVLRLDRGGELLARGAAAVVSVGTMYAAGAVVGPEAQVGAYAEATGKAVAAGFSGLRVAAEATPLARTAEQRDSFARYEHLIDRAMRAMPFAALCGYDVGELGAEAVGELACLHPVVREGATQFRLYAGRETELALAGELDTLVAAPFAAALERAAPAFAGGELLVEADELRFIDHNALRVLSALAVARGGTVVLQDAPGMAARVLELLDLPGLRLEATP